MAGRGRRRGAAALSLLLATAGCANYVTPLETAPPAPRSPTRVYADLQELPAPQEQVVAAIYRFRDQTGQYKPSETGASWSTAVTQGATSILMEALEESGWFIPIEREGLSNLLNERQIIQSIRAQYQGPQGENLGPLPPLLYAGVILEGGVIGYDTNVLTSGVGARYFGAGGSGQYRQDQVTIYLRAISTQTGRVLKSVSTTKTIASQQVEFGIFRFIEVDRLLESEIGYSQNEPAVVAVTEAIEEAVKGLIIEGVRDGLWAVADTADLDHPAFAAYDRDRAHAAELGPFGELRTADRSGFALAFAGGGRRYQGNYSDPLDRPVGEMELRWMPSPRWGVGLVGTAGEIGAENAFRTTVASAELRGIYYLLPRGSVSPFFRVGGGALQKDVRAPVTRGTLYPFASIGGGLEHLAAPGLGLSVSLYNQYTFTDEFDGVTTGSGSDSVWNLVLGLTLY